MADVLKRTVRANTLLTRNELDFYNQEYYKANQTFVESTHQRVVLATNMVSASEFDLGGIETGAVLQLSTDRPISMSVNVKTNLVELAENGMFMMVGSFTHVYVQNESTTYQATVEIVATD